ncbi:hypothetical protein BLA29_008364, partial [Euroglyphus maynei]
MKRSKSTYSMNGNCNHYEEEDVPHNKTSYSDRSLKLMHAPSPTLSMKSAKSFSDRYCYSDVSDSSSSSQSRNKVNRVVRDAKRKIESKVWADDEKEILNEPRQWSCIFCTFMNDSDRNVCDICCKTRILSNPEQILSNDCNNRIDKTSFSTETTEQKQDNFFDESFLSEQIRIEKEEENELRVTEENKNLKINHSISEPSSIKKSEKSTNIDEKTLLNDDNSKVLEHEKIVAKIIEEKITEQFEKLKLSPPVT